MIFRFFKVNHCPHMNLKGIYGDQINHTPKGRRLKCLDCHTYLDGSAALSWMRSGEWAAAHRLPEKENQ